MAEKALKMPNIQFKRIIGTQKSVFQMMRNVLEIAHKKLQETAEFDVILWNVNKLTFLSL